MIVRVACLVLLVVICTVQAQRKAGQLTHYCSYPACCENKKMNAPYTDAEKNSCDKKECTLYSGCKYQGDFAFCGKLSHKDVINKKIIAFWAKNEDVEKKYAMKTLRIYQGKNQIDAIVCDTCADTDCKGCCSQNAGSSGYLIDMESNTYSQFKASDGPVTWECLDCK